VVWGLTRQRVFWPVTLRSAYGGASLWEIVDMPDDTKVYSFASATRDFFGLREGQGVKGFMDELRALSDGDRASLKGELVKVGYNIQ